MLYQMSESGIPLVDVEARKRTSRVALRMAREYMVIQVHDHEMVERLARIFSDRQ